MIMMVSNIEVLAAFNALKGNGFILLNHLSLPLLKIVVICGAIGNRKLKLKQQV